jgi:GTP-binding protein
MELGEELPVDGAESEEEGTPPRIVRVAIVGRPNVGKSSLLNKLLGEERAIVSDIPGTTRDAIDTSLDWNGTPIRLVDTAGIRRRGKVASGPAAEKFSTLRAVRAVGRADVCVLVIDASEGLTAQDAHVAGYVVEEGTGLVVAINKWDLVEKTGRTFDEYVARVRGEAPFLDFAPIIAISAMTGQRVGRVLDAALEVAAGRRRRISTGELNRVLGDAAFRQPAPPVKGRRPRFYYATQVAIEPPTFVLFARDADAVHFSYKRYLENRLRDAFGFGGSPMRLIFRERSQVELEPRRRAPARSRPGARNARPGAGKRPARPTKAPKTPKR